MSKDPGLYEAWNVCCKRADTPLVGNWNVDDRKSPWSLEALMQPFLLDKDLDISYGATFVSEKANENWDSVQKNVVYPCNETNSWKDLILNNNPHCMPIWKKSIHERFGYFNSSYKTAADSDMWIRAVKGGAKITLYFSLFFLSFEKYPLTLSIILYELGIPNIFQLPIKYFVSFAINKNFLYRFFSIINLNFLN